MKNFLLLLPLLIAPTVFAQSTTTTTVDTPPVTAPSTVTANADPELDEPTLSNNYSIEIGAQFLDDSGAQSLTNSSTGSPTYRSTDSLYTVTIRKYFSEEFDLSLTIPFGENISNDQQYNQTVNASVSPWSIGGRYHWSYFSDLIRPFAQVDFGEAFITEGGYNLDSGDYQEVSYVRPFMKAAIGSDFAFSRNSDLYVGVRAGYFIIKDFGGLNTGVELGYKL